MSGVRPVPANAVRVWSGFRREGMSPPDFRERLADTFIPATVSFGVPLGLTAYLPAVLPEAKREVVPDEIALVFYESQEMYWDGRKTLGGRVYAVLHDAVFSSLRSWSDFPRRLGQSIEPGQPYHVFDESADWQMGHTRILVGASREGEGEEDFAAAIYGFLDAIRRRRERGLEGVIVSLKDDCLVYWEHWTDEERGRRSPVGMLATRIVPVMVRDARPLPLRPVLEWTPKRLELRGGECFNTLFAARAMGQVSGTSP